MTILLWRNLEYLAEAAHKKVLKISSITNQKHFEIILREIELCNFYMTLEIIYNLSGCNLPQKRCIKEFNSHTYTAEQDIWIFQYHDKNCTVHDDNSSCRRQFNSRAMKRASGNYAFVRWRHWDEASECS